MTTTDNRDLAEMVRYLEARVECLQKALKCAQAELVALTVIAKKPKLVIVKKRGRA